MFARFVNNKSVDVRNALITEEGIDFSDYIEFDLPIGNSRFILENDVVRSMTDEELIVELNNLGVVITADRVRAKRDVLLSNADVLSQADRWAGYSNDTKALITTYKQALRDISLQKDFPANVVFPEVIVV